MRKNIYDDFYTYIYIYIHTYTYTYMHPERSSIPCEKAPTAHPIAFLPGVFTPVTPEDGAVEHSFNV